uniref:uncharacterized protein LOC120952675 isoform X2 n=1 Tax=Anopheles coluzzii TaxID=1518534 RepID=UPI0020FFA761|nr:uncharacterized protein LOC120952675 isoform X2 [Anopheles coluzzii]
MSYTEYSKELEAFIAKQRQLLELDKERIQRIKQEDPHTRHTPSRPEELQKDDVSVEEIASDNCPANDKLSKEKVNSQLSKKTATVPDVEAGPSGKAPRERNVSSASSIDSRPNMDHRARNVVATPTTPTDAAPSPPPATVPSAARAKQMSPQQDEMEQWVSDTFFSYFPSFNKKQKEKKTVLSRTRQQEYQEYLKNIPEVTTKHQQYMQKYGTGKSPGGTEATNEKGTGNAPTSPPAAAGTGPGGGATGQPQVRFGKSLVAEGNSNYRKGSPREKLIQDLAHTDLPTILNTDTIDRRNRMLADEESRRKLEYQKELIKQIEEKRKEVERLREKEKLEEEMLTSRLEQQLKTMQLEEQLEHERLRSEKIRIANEQNHIRRLQLLANLENDHKVFNPYDGQRKAFSENGGKAAAAAASSDTKPTVPQPNGGAFSSGDERTKAAYQRYISNSATQQQEKQQPTHLHPFVSVAPAVSTNALALSTEQEDYESSSETTADTSVMVGGGGGAVDDHRFQYCKSCRTDGDRSRLPLQPALGKHSKRRQHCAKCKRPEAYNGGKRGEDGNSRCIRCERTMKRAMNGTKGASLCAVCTLSTEADQQNKNFLYHPKKQQYHHTERRHHRAPLETDDDDVQVHRAVATTTTTTTSTVSPSQKNPFKVIDIQYHESDNEHGDLDVLNPVIVRNNYRKPPFSLNIDKDSLFHPSKKPPEPVFTVNIRNGEVFVDNKLRSGGAGPSRYAPPDSPPLSDGDGETSSATVGDDLMDDRIAKYVRHYNTLWMKRGNGRKGNSKGQQHNDYHHHHHHSSHHHHQQHHHNHREQEQHSNDRVKGNKTGPLLPSLSPPKVYVSDRPDNLKSDALKLMEKKWEVPAVERTKVNEKGSTRVLTQLGAIRKQLQLEQLQMDGGPSGYSKNY